MTIKTRTPCCSAAFLHAISYDACYLVCERWHFRRSLPVPLKSKQLELTSGHLCDAHGTLHLCICVTVHKIGYSAKPHKSLQLNNGSSRKYLKILTLTVAKLQTYGEKPQKCAWKILDYVIRWLLCDVPRNRAIVWALFVSICVLFSICLVSAGNSEGAQEVLRKLHGGGCVISFQRLKLPREIFH